MYLVQLNNLVASVRLLYVTASTFWHQKEGQPPLVAELRNILNRLNLLALVQECPTIAVGGLQGVGKTALTRVLYQLDPGILPESAGRDERTPVRIVTHDSDELQAFKLCTNNDDGNMLRQRISVADLREGARAFGEAFAFELKVPRRRFMAPDDPRLRLAWLLLPGSEATEQEWGRRVAIAMKAAEACLLVTSPPKVADGRHKEFLQQLKNDFGSQPLAVAITGADLSADSNQQVAKVIQQLLELPTEQVVATSVSLEGGHGWVEPLLGAVVRSLAGQQLTAIRLDELSNLVTQELRTVINNIRQHIIADAASDRIQVATEVTPVIEAFDTEVTLLRQDFQKALRQQIQSRRNIQVQAWLEHVAKLGLKEDLRAIFVGNLQQRLRFQNTLRELWKESDVCSGLYEALRIAQERRINIVAKSSARKLTILETSSDKKIAPNQSGINNYRVGRAQLELNVDNEDLANLHYLAGHENAQPTPKLRKVVQILPLLAVEGACFRYQASQLLARSSTDPQQSPAAKDLMTSLQQTDTFQWSLLKALGMLVSVDFATDAQFDPLARLASALGLAAKATSAGGVTALVPTIAGAATAAATAATPTIGATTGAATTAAATTAGTGAATGTTTIAATTVTGTKPATTAAVTASASGASLGTVLIATAAALTVVTALTYREIVRQEFRLAEWGSLALQAWADDAEAAALERFDDGMLQIKHRLIDVLSCRHGLDLRLGERQRLAAINAQCEHHVKEVHSEILRRRPAFMV